MNSIQARKHRRASYRLLAGTALAMSVSLAAFAGDDHLAIAVAALLACGSVACALTAAEHPRVLELGLALLALCQLLWLAIG